MAELVIDKVDKIYHSRKGDVHAVKALDLSVEPGEIVALLGSSGCGKTSTLRMIAGFEEVSNGSITLRGERYATLTQNRAYWLIVAPSAGKRAEVQTFVRWLRAEVAESAQQRASGKQRTRVGGRES